MEKIQNLMIESWKMTTESIALARQLLTEEDQKNWIKNYAEKTIQQIEEKRPDKTKTALEQMNQDQKDLMEYLNKVKETGELE